MKLQSTLDRRSEPNTVPILYYFRWSRHLEHLEGRKFWDDMDHNENYSAGLHQVCRSLARFITVPTIQRSDNLLARISCANKIRNSSKSISRAESATPTKNMKKVSACRQACTYRTLSQEQHCVFVSLSHLCVQHARQLGTRNVLDEWQKIMEKHNMKYDEVKVCDMTKNQRKGTVDRDSWPKIHEWIQTSRKKTRMKKLQALNDEIGEQKDYTSQLEWKSTITVFELWNSHEYDQCGI